MSTHSVSLDDLDLEETYPNEDPVHGLPEQSTKVLALREAMAEAKTAGKTGPLQTEEGIEVWQEANSKLQIMARMNMGGRKRRASIERRCRLNLGDADLPQLEVAMQQHMDFWMMRNLVLDDSPDRLAEMLFESEQFFRQKRKKTKAGDDTSNLSPPNLFQESGVNTLDPDFGWNIGMHCTALGKVDHMQAALDIHLTLKDYYDIDDGSSSDEEFTETSLDPDIKTDHGGAWEQPFPLDLGHKSYRTLDLRHVYGHAIDGIEDADLRRCFQGDETTGYWAREGKSARGHMKWYPMKPFLRGSTPETIAGLCRQKLIKRDVVQALKRSEDARRKGDQLASMTAATIDYTDEASAAYLECLRSQNMFGDTAASMMMLYLSKRTRREGQAAQRIDKSELLRKSELSRQCGVTDKEHRKNYRRALAVFEAWLQLDPRIFSLNIEKASLLFMVAIEHGVGNGIHRDDIRLEEMQIAERIMELLGPGNDGADILDFTLQNEHGRTLKWLCRGIIDQNVHTPLRDVPDGVDSSAPFFIELIPNEAELLMYQFWPLYLYISPIVYYADLVLDIWLWMEYAAQMDCYPYKRGILILSISVWVLSIFVTCLFDYLTTLVTKRDRQSPERRWELAKKCILNITQLRLPYETWRSLQAMKEYEIVDGMRVDRTARLPPMSYDQVKCAEGVFESLPQSLIQAFVVIYDLYLGQTVTHTAFVSLFSAYVISAVTLGLMGPPDISIAWRACFMVWAALNVILRSISIAFVAILQWEEWEYKWLGHKVLPIFGVIVASFCFVVLVSFKLHGRRANTSTFILTVIMWICPVEISEFTILKTASPKSPQLPFAFIRYLEIVVCCALFANHQVVRCTLHSSVQWLHVASNSDSGTRIHISATDDAWQARASYYCDTATLNNSYTSIASAVAPDFVSSESKICEEEFFLSNNTATERWLFFDKEQVHPPEIITCEDARITMPDGADECSSALPDDVAVPWERIPFNIHAWLAALILFNILCYLIANMVPYKIIDPTPAGLKRLLYGSEIQSFTSCCRGNEVTREIRSFKGFSTLLDAVEEIEHKIQDVGHILAGNDPEAAKREKLMKQEREREITAERERELKEGRAAKKMMTQILKVLNRDKVLLPGVLESKQPSALVQSNTRGRWRSATKRVQESQRMQAHSRMVSNLEKYCVLMHDVPMWWVEESLESVTARARVATAYPDPEVPAPAPSPSSSPTTKISTDWKKVLSKLSGEGHDTGALLSAHETKAAPELVSSEPVDEHVRQRAVLGLTRVLESRRSAFNADETMIYWAGASGVNWSTAAAAAAAAAADTEDSRSAAAGTEQTSEAKESQRSRTMTLDQLRMTSWDWAEQMPSEETATVRTSAPLPPVFEAARPDTKQLAARGAPPPRPPPRPSRARAASALAVLHAQPTRRSAPVPSILKTSQDFEAQGETANPLARVSQREGDDDDVVMV